jgi:hypothetical protein
MPLGMFGSSKETMASVEDFLNKVERRLLILSLERLWSKATGERDCSTGESESFSNRILDRSELVLSLSRITATFEATLVNLNPQLSMHLQNNPYHIFRAFANIGLTHRKPIKKNGIKKSIL